MKYGIDSWAHMFERKSPTDNCLYIMHKTSCGEGRHIQGHIKEVTDILTCTCNFPR